jgi:DNA-binding NarL/FixJ family response regulator
MHIVIVDDHPLFREGLKTLLSSLDPTVRTSEAGTVAQAVALAATESPDLVLLDMNLPGVSGLDALREVKAAFESASVVVVSGDENPFLVRTSIDAGASGYIPKTTDSALTIQALRLVLAHGVYLPRSALTRVSAARPADGAVVFNDPPQLSERQMAVL